MQKMRQPQPHLGFSELNDFLGVPVERMVLGGNQRETNSWTHLGVYQDEGFLRNGPGFRVEGPKGEDYWTMGVFI